MNMISLCRGVFLLFLASALSIQGSVAQDLEVRQQIRPLQTDAPPLIDGVLDDAVWAQAESHNNFRQTQPILDADPSEGSWFRIAYDSDNLYVAFRAYDSDPAAVVATELRRDADMESQDHVVFMFDTFADRRNAFGFAMNPAGALHDGRVENNANWVS